jgi:integrase
VTVYGKTKREVRAKLDALKLDRSKHKLTGSAHQTVGHCLDEWLKVSRARLRPSTVANYALAIRWLSRYLGEVRLDKLRSTHIEHCYASLQAGGLSGRSVQLAHSVLRPALKRAMRDGLIAVNPTEVVSVPKSEPKEMQSLTQEQVDTLLETIADNPLRALYVLLVTSAVRIGEALALRWTDVDLDEGSIAIRRTVQRITGHGLVEGEPKSKSSRRTVYLLDIAIAELRGHLVRQGDQRLVMGPEWHENGLVFPSTVGTFLDPTNVHHRFERVLKSAGLPVLRLHDMRHTAATLALEAGIHPKVVQDMLGHSSYNLTMNTYSHVMPTLHREAVQTMNRRYNRKKKKTKS